MVGTNDSHRANVTRHTVAPAWSWQKVEIRTRTREWGGGGGVMLSTVRYLSWIIPGRQENDDASHFSCQERLLRTTSGSSGSRCDTLVAVGPRAQKNVTEDL